MNFILFIMQSENTYHKTYKQYFSLASYKIIDAENFYWQTIYNFLCILRRWADFCCCQHINFSYVHNFLYCYFRSNWKDKFHEGRTASIHSCSIFSWLQYDLWSIGWNYISVHSCPFSTKQISVVVLKLISRIFANTALVIQLLLGKIKVFNIVLTKRKRGEK